VDHGEHLVDRLQDQVAAWDYELALADDGAEHALRRKMEIAHSLPCGCRLAVHLLLHQ
jgi:hypothetical protein